MLRELFRIPFFNLPIYSYGLMLVIGFLACSELARRMARHRGLDGEFFVNCTLIAILTGCIGARLSHVLENFGTYTNPNRSVLDNFLDAINFRAGGMTFYGGFIFATPCCIFYTLKKKVPLRPTMDIVAPVVMLGLGLGRIGCYLNGCCYGEICRPSFATSWTQFPYDSFAYVDQFDRYEQLREYPEIRGDPNYAGIDRFQPPPSELIDPTRTFADGTPALKDWDQVRSEHLTALADAQKSLPVQPTQLYSAFTALLLCALLWAYWSMHPAGGKVFALMMMLEGPARFILELIRVEPAVLKGKVGPIDVDMSLSMVLGLVVFAAGVIMWLGLSWQNPAKNQRILATTVEKGLNLP